MEKFGSSFEGGRKARGVGAISWCYLQRIVNLVENAWCMSQIAGEGRSVFLSDDVCRGERHRGESNPIQRI